MAAFADRDLVFFDPDNGLEVKSANGEETIKKYVLLNEVAKHYGAGRSVLVYQHHGNALPHRAFVKEKAAKLRAVLADASVSAFDTPHVVFLLAARPEHAKRVVTAATGSSGTAHRSNRSYLLYYWIACKACKQDVINENEALPKVIAATIHCETCASMVK